jgi:hypothetical protein
MAMKIFIPRVPKTVTTDDLKEFSAEMLEKKFRVPFTTMPGIVSCDILRIKDIKLGITEHHGLVSIRPDSAGLWFIHNLKSSRLHNKLLLARQYYARKGAAQGITPEGERRRKHLEVSKFHMQEVEIHGLDQFAQTHIN